MYLYEDLVLQKYKEELSLNTIDKFWYYATFTIPMSYTSDNIISSMILIHGTISTSHIPLPLLISQSPNFVSVN